MKAKTVSFWENAKKFIRINIFVQTFRFKAMRWWYWVDLSATLIQRLLPIFEIYMFGIIINEVQIYALRQEGDPNKIFMTIGITVIVRLLAQLYNSLFQRFDWFYSTQAMDTAISKAFIEKLLYLNWEHIETPEIEKRISRTLNRAADFIARLADLHISFVVIFISLITTFTIAKAPSWVIILILLKVLPSVYITAYNAILRHKADDESQDSWYKRGAIFEYFRQFSTLLEIKTAQGQGTLLKTFDTLTVGIRNIFLNKEKKVTIPYLLAIAYGAVIDTAIYI